GGFHRYSVDARWLVPHFEKMLYDNALLARLYTRAWQWKKDPFFAHIANEILGFVQRELTSPDGGFYSTLDADSEGVEGKFYVWSRGEVIDVLGEEEGRIFSALYDISERGNWEGHNILNVPRDPESVAADQGVTLKQLSDIAARGKCKLYGVRSQRVWPARDEKILTRFADEANGGFFDTPVDHEKLITRPKDLFDNATPSGNSVTADVLLRLALLFGREDFVESATRSLESTFPLAERYPSGFGFL